MKIKNLKASLDLQAYSMIFALLAIWALFYLVSGGIFISPRNISNLSIQMAVTAILTTGMVLVIVSGNIDLSVGSLMGMLGGVAAILQVNHHLNTTLTIVITLIFGILIGLLQGFVISYLKVPAFILTLGGLLAYRGVLLGITQGRTISPMNPSFVVMGQSYISEPISAVLSGIVILSIGYALYRSVAKQSQISVFIKIVKIVVPPSLILIYTLMVNTYQGIPVAVVLMVVTIAIFTFIAQNTTFGRGIYAIGGNAEAALYSGIKVKKILLGVFILQGFLSALAGMVLAARLNAGTISAGQSLEMDVIAAAVIGGTSLSGGKGTVPGAILGALVMASLDNGMSIMNIDAYWQMILKGAILVVAVYVDVLNTDRKKSI